ncbi:MAG TPA: PQQ-binding-like beta-propeller repeat protein, partial [Gemmatales bacterium]|nr:PQQ-binding-like beta-propeller repeat protein [Gemmatales bacterium]
TTECVIVSERGVADTMDVFRCISAKDGKEIWAYRHPAPGPLDYGSSPRATPIITEKYAYLFGAWGHLHCVELETGLSVWQLDVREEFQVKDKLAWGMCGTPLLVQNKLILAVGAPDASLVALDPETGKLLWKTPGEQASYGSFIAGILGGKMQIVGHDANSLGGWDIESGKRLWKLKPEKEGDYNVPAPIIYEDKLLVTTENNGTRLYGFDPAGVIHPIPIADCKELAPETHTPVVIGHYVYGVWNRMFCLDLKSGLKVAWSHEDDAFIGHANIIADQERLLITTSDGEVVLIEANADACKVVGRMRVFDDEKSLYSHPALVGNRLYMRSSNSLVALELPRTPSDK